VTGKRSDAASRYLYPQSGNLSLEIIVGKRVKRVMIKCVRFESIIYSRTDDNDRNGRAVGIEYTTDEAGSSSDLFAANASKLVVISAGAFGSSSILERSGIGGASFLEKNNIPILVDLPGVGENYLGKFSPPNHSRFRRLTCHFSDHFGAESSYHPSEDLDIMKDVWSDPDAGKGDSANSFKHLYITVCDVSVIDSTTQRMGGTWNRKDCSQVRLFFLWLELVTRCPS
jgi:alcohol oxidase